MSQAAEVLQEPPAEPADTSPRRSVFRRSVRSLLRDRAAVVGALIVISLAVAGVLAPLLAPHDPNAVDPARRLAGFSAEFPLGTDHLGRDVLSRLLYATRLSLGTAAVTASVVAGIGVAVGMVAGYLRGIVDTLISRVVDVVLAVPSLLLALAITGMLGSSLRNVMLAVIAVWWAGYARVVRGATMAERERPYIEAAHAGGASQLRVMRRHLLPNVFPPIVILTTLDMGAILLAISALSFLGVGVPTPTPELGSMLSEARTYLRTAPKLMLYPGATIFLAVLGFNLLGDGLRDALDPRTRR